MHQGIHAYFFWYGACHPFEDVTSSGITINGNEVGSRTPSNYTSNKYMPDNMGNCELMVPLHMFYDNELIKIGHYNGGLSEACPKTNTNGYDSRVPGSSSTKADKDTWDSARQLVINTYPESSTSNCIRWLFPLRKLQDA